MTPAPEMNSASVRISLKVEGKEDIVFPSVTSIRVTKEKFIFKTLNMETEIVALKNVIKALTVSGFITIKYEED